MSEDLALSTAIESLNNEAETKTPLHLLGEVLIATRKERGLSQAALARMLGVHQEAIARWEREKYRTTSIERLIPVASALGLRLYLTKELVEAEAY